MSRPATPAYPGGLGDVQRECEATDDEIVIRVSDWGIGIDQASAQPGLGLGILLIERLSDHVTHSHSQGITVVEMRFNRSGAAAEHDLTGQHPARPSPR